jgi:ATP-dependent DNA ligase
MTAGRRIATVASQHPAHFVAFDLLAADGDDLRGQPLHDRRRVLERVLSGMTSPIVLCQQTEDQDVAREWFATFTAAGIEGLVIKDSSSRYPTRHGQRVWFKVKARATVEMLAVGFTGSAASPTSLVLAVPGTVDDDGTPMTAGSTTALNTAAAKAVAPLLTPTGDSFERVFAWGARRPTTVFVVEPLVVEVSADAAASAGVLRHAARLVRARPDLTVEDVTGSG